MFGGKWGDACKLKNTIPTVKHGDGSIMLTCVLLQEGLVHFKIDGIMRHKNYVDILKQRRDSQEVEAWSQMGLPNGQ